MQFRILLLVLLVLLDLNSKITSSTVHFFLFFHTAIFTCAIGIT